MGGYVHGGLVGGIRVNCLLDIYWSRLFGWYYTMTVYVKIKGNKIINVEGEPPFHAFSDVTKPGISLLQTLSHMSPTNMFMVSSLVTSKSGLGNANS